jgi:hypothetical protein
MEGQILDGCSEAYYAFDRQDTLRSLYCPFAVVGLKFSLPTWERANQAEVR